MRTSFLVLMFCAALVGCDRSEAPSSSSTAPQSLTPTAANTAAAVDWTNTLLAHAQTAHSELQGAATLLQEKIGALLQEPNNNSLRAARQAWRDAHQAYKATRFYHYLGMQHPELDTQSNQPLKHKIHQRIDSFPLEPGYLDYVEGYPFSGLVFSESVVIDSASLNQQHQFDDLSQVTLGFHAMEFLLWGENLSQESRRPWHDYDLIAGGQAANEREMIRYRRRQLLQILCDLLVQDLNQLSSAWQQPQGFYPSDFSRVPKTEQLQLVRTALEKALRQEVILPLQRILALAGKDWDMAAVESSFSHNGKADLLAVIRPLKWALVDHEGLPAQSAVSLGLSDEQHEQLTRLQTQLRQSLIKLSDTAFAPTSSRLRSEDVAELRKINDNAVAMLDLLLSTTP